MTRLKKFYKMKDKIIKDETGRPIRIDVTPEDIMTMPITELPFLVGNLNLLPQGATEYIQKRLDKEFRKSKEELKEFVRFQIDTLPVFILEARDKMEGRLNVSDLFDSGSAFCVAHALVEVCDSIRDKDADYESDLAIFKGQIRTAIEGFINDKIPEL